MRPRARVLLAIPLGLLLAWCAFLFGPSVDVQCTDFHRPTMADVDGAPGAPLCFAPSPANWVLIGLTVLGTPLVAAFLDVQMQLLARGGRREARSSDRR